MISSYWTLLYTAGRLVANSENANHFPMEFLWVRDCQWCVRFVAD
jgi:hypothetical protein